MNWFARLIIGLLCLALLLVASAVSSLVNVLASGAAHLSFFADSHFPSGEEDD